jgi:hypothetical protein
MANDGDLSPMEEGMVQLHEVYLAFRKGGFSRSEATSIIAKMGIELMQSVIDEQSDADG